MPVNVCQMRHLKELCEPTLRNVLPQAYCREVTDQKPVDRNPHINYCISCYLFTQNFSSKHFSLRQSCIMFENEK